MKTTLLIFVFFSFSSLMLYGQNNVLVLTKKKNQKEKVVKEQKSIKAITSDNVKHKGRLVITDETHIVLGADTLSLSDIETIRTKSLASQITGGVVTTIGGITTTTGAYIFIELVVIDGRLFSMLVGIILGVPITVVGVLATTTGVLVLVIGKKHKKEKWDYSIGNRIEQATD